jgi:ABC-type glycerol-3-phosphate transport system permease component
MSLRTQSLARPQRGLIVRENAVSVLRKAAAQAPAYVLLSVLAFLAIVPFVFLLFSAFKPYAELIDPFPTLLPKHWSLAALEEIITRQGFLLAFWNTVWVAGGVTLIQALTSSAAGYVFAKYNFPFREALFQILLATMMIPFAVVLIPLYVTVAQIHLVDNLWALILIAVWNTFSLFTMRSFMESVPRDLIEAARIDGAGEFWIYSRIVIPLALAPLTTISVFTFLGQWDNFMFPSVLINSQSNWTLPLLLTGLRSIYLTRYDMLISGSLLTILPVLIAYAFAQRTFVRGAQTSGLKG